MTESSDPRPTEGGPMPGVNRRQLLGGRALVAGGAAFGSCPAGGDAPSPGGSPGGGRAATPLAPPLQPGAEIPPGQVEAAVERLDALVAGILAKSTVPGLATAVVHKGKVLYAKGFGVRKVWSPGDVTPDTVFQIASMSKPIGATVVANQVTKGTVAWTTPVRRHLPEFVLKDPYVSAQLTIADLYAHRSGLPSHAGDLLEDLGYDRAQILRRLRYLALQPYRISYNYTNFGMTAAAQAVANAAGLDWASLSDRELYRPLGMTSTSSRFADYEARAERAFTHVRIDGAWTAEYIRTPDEQSPAGGVSSSVNDLAKWMIMVLGDGTGADGQTIAPPEALTPAITPQIVSAPASAAAVRAGYYGYGFDVSVQSSGRTQLSHSGAFSAGTGTNVLLSPLEGFGVVTLTNGTPVGAAEALNQEFADLAVYGQPVFDWWGLYSPALGGLSQPFGHLAGKNPPTNPRPPADPRLLAGSYANDYVGTAIVEASGSRLATLRLGPQRTPFALRHWDGDNYTYEPTGESANPGSVSRVTFDRGASGRATSLTIEYYQQDGMGTFTRRL